MEFRILGPLEVLENGRQIDLGGAKQRALLAPVDAFDRTSTPSRLQVLTATRRSRRLSA